MKADVLNCESGLMDKRGVAKKLNCSVRQVDSLREKEGLPFVKLGGSVKFVPEHVDVWIEANTVNHPANDGKGGRDE